MRGVKRSCRGEQFTPLDASFVILPSTVRISDGATDINIPSSSIERSQVLSDAQQGASVEGCRVQTRFPAEQLRLWVTFTRMPRVFMAERCLLNTLAVLEVADMLNDSKSTSTLCDALARDHVAPLEHMPLNAPPPPPHAPAGAAATSGTPAAPPRVYRRNTPRANLRARRKCMQPQPCLALRDAFLWGVGLTLGGILRSRQTGSLPQGCGGGSGADVPDRRRNRRSHRKSIDHTKHRTGKLLGSHTLASTSHAYGVAMGGPGEDRKLHATAVRKALEHLPEHLLLRVLRAWDVPVATQLASLPPRLHPAALAAAHPSIACNRTVSIGGYHLHNAALRAAAALASVRRVDTVTLTPLCSPARSDTQDCDLFYAPAPLQAAARHLRHASAITSLALKPCPALLQSSYMHGLSCIAAMPHLRCIRIEQVAMPALPALVGTLACMSQLRELHLGVREVPLVVRSGCGGASVVGRRLVALTTLEAVKLTLAYNQLHFRGRAQTVDHVALLLRDLEDKRVEVLGEHFRFEGTRRPSAVLGALRAASPALDLQRCSIEESGDGETSALPPASVDAVLRALVARECGADAAVSLTGVVLLRDGMLQSGDMGTVGVAPAMLGSLPGLCGLALEFYEPQEIDIVMAQDLAQHLPGLTRLTELNFGLSTFGAGTAQLLLPRLAPLTALQLLDLMDVCMRPEGAVALAAALPSLGALTRLRLQGNAIGERGGAAVMTALAPAAAAGMQELRLAWTGIGPRGAAALGARLPEMTSLRELSLCGCGIAGGLGGLQGGFETRAARLPMLTKLDLAENLLECSDAVVLAHMLPRLPKLRDLALGANKLAPAGARALACQIVRLQHLWTVDLRMNYIGDAGAKALARALRRKALRDQGLTCRAYMLSSCGIGDAGALAIADAIHRVCAGKQAVMGRVAARDRNSYFVFLQGNEISARMADALHELSERSRRHGLHINFCATP